MILKRRIGTYALLFFLLLQTSTLLTTVQGVGYEEWIVPIHRNLQDSSSVFTFGNDGVVSGLYTLDFFWPNTELVGTDGPFELAPGETIVYDMSEASFGETVYYGYVVITSKEPILTIAPAIEYGAIIGTIFENDGTTPLQTITVEAHVEPGNLLHMTYVLFDGTFYIGGLSNGDYVVKAHAEYPWGGQWYDEATTRYAATTITISSGTLLVDLPFTMHPGGKISGSVTDIYENPLEGIRVAAINDDNDELWVYTHTDDLGYYQIHVPRSDWNLEFMDPYHQYITEYYTDSRTLDNAVPITISGGADIYTEINEDLTLLSIDLQERVTQLETENEELRARLDAVERTSMALAVRGSDSGIYWKKYENEEWGTWTKLPGSTPDTPALTMLDNNLHMVVMGSDNKIYHGWVDIETDVFSGWNPITGSTQNAPILIPLP